MAQITIDDIVIALLIVSIIFMISSLPKILLTVRHSSKLLKRYRLLRSIDDLDKKENVSKDTLNEWNAVRSQMVYTNIITEEIEKLNSLKPAFFQAELAAILFIILAIVPGFSDTGLTIAMIAIAVLAFLAVFYAGFNTYNYKREYLVILKEVNESKADTAASDRMYG